MPGFTDVVAGREKTLQLQCLFPLKWKMESSAESEGMIQILRVIRSKSPWKNRRDSWLRKTEAGQALWQVAYIRPSLCIIRTIGILISPLENCILKACPWKKTWTKRSSITDEITFLLSPTVLGPKQAWSKGREEEETRTRTNVIMTWIYSSDQGTLFQQQNLIRCFRWSTSSRCVAELRTWWNQAT